MKGMWLEKDDEEGRRYGICILSVQFGIEMKHILIVIVLRRMRDVFTKSRRCLITVPALSRLETDGDGTGF